MAEPKILLYTLRGDLAEYVRLLTEKGFGPQLLPCRNREDIDRQIEQAEIIFGVHLPHECYAKATKLKWIQSMWAGVDKILSASIRPEVIITKPFGVFGQYLAQYAFGYFLADQIQLQRNLKQQERKEWKFYQIERIRGKVIGVAGVGDIGQEIVRVAQAFKMQVWGLNSRRKPELHLDKQFVTEEIEEFVAGLDLLVCTLPLTPATRGLFSRQVLEQLKPSAMVINLGRGPIFDEVALAELLANGQIRLAVLDVFSVEPLPQDSPFWTLPNCIVTPHVAGPSLPEDITDCFLENYSRYITGKPLLAVIDRNRGY
ncbi:MAG: D-2-hydroxyacid dehydrogenase [Acidobacteriota bacterium]|nr:D-2-hydroxyacid dehydrogenase [Blastocatellia bacterium]MDW8412101.1 D-2-hydroxyacid dehydrogenase [Acidobacteriota bacterium]